MLWDSHGEKENLLLYLLLDHKADVGTRSLDKELKYKKKKKRERGLCARTLCDIVCSHEV